MEILVKKLKSLIESLEDSDIIFSQVAALVSVYPFNEYEYMIATLVGRNKLSLDDYYLLRDEYIHRNLYLYVFEINAPRGFGERWAQGHLKALAPLLEKPSKIKDPSYSGQYDFMLDDKIKIEVKASRAVDSSVEAPLYEKALSKDSKKPFIMNFQQIKPKCCDVFVWIAVWRDVINYWILSSKEVESNKYYSKGQHRGNTGEGQLHLKDTNIMDFIPYEVAGDNLIEKIRAANGREL